MLLSEHLGSDTFLKIDAADLGILTVRASGEVGVRHGDTVRLAPDFTKLHRFDAEGLALA